MDFNRQKQLVYVAALGNHSLEIIDLKQGKTIHSINGLDEPQGVAYVGPTKEFMVANGGNGECDFFNSENFEKLAGIDLGSDADDVRYDSTNKTIYVGYGNGGIAVIDAVKHQKLADIKLDGHPEGFQLDQKLNELFVNIPDAHQIAVIDLKTQKIIRTWKTEFNSNFPLAIDIADDVIFVGYRHPSKLVAINAVTGNSIATINLVGDVDDLYYSESSKKIYASGGGGAINIFSFENSMLKPVGNIVARDGARTSLLIAELNYFILAERASIDKPAQLQVFALKN